MSKNSNILFGSFDDSPEFLSALGKVTLEFSRLEAELSSFIILLLHCDVPAVGILVTSKLSFKQQIPILMALYRYRVTDTKRVEELRKLLQLCEGTLSPQRDKYVHAHWYSVINSHHIVFWKDKAQFKRGFQREITHTSSDAILELATKVKEAQIRLAKIGYQYFQTLKVPPKPKK